MPAGVAGQVMALTPVGGFLLSAAIFGGEITWDVDGQHRADRRRHHPDPARLSGAC